MLVRRAQAPRKCKLVSLCCLLLCLCLFERERTRTRRHKKRERERGGKREKVVFMTGFSGCHSTGQFGIKTQYKEPTSPMDIMSINDGKEVIDLLDDNLDSDEILEAILTFLETKSKVKIMKPIKKFLENLLEEVIGYSVDCGICNVTSHYSLDTPYGTCQCS